MLNTESNIKYRFDTIESAIETIKNGGMVIVADDESRENEGTSLLWEIESLLRSFTRC